MRVRVCARVCACVCVNVPFIPARLWPKKAMAVNPVIQSAEVAATYRIILLGQSTVGKTSLMSKFTTGKFQYSLTATVGESVSCWHGNSTNIPD